MTPETDRRAAHDARSGRAAGILGVAAVRRFLRLSLFWKIAVANLALLIGSGAVILWASSRLTVGGLTAFELLALLVAVLVNAALVHTALTPLESLERVARRVGEGDLDARVGASPLADLDLDRLTSVFNRMLDALSENRARQRELARRVLESEERERERIAHELFSGTAQTLAAVLLRLRVAERTLANCDSRALREIREGVVSALEEIRGVAKRLRPPELDELGVRAALESHARAVSEGRSIELRLAGEVPELSRESALALFRIVQEAITNAVLHADADLVTVTFRAEGDSVVVDVVDDGNGFEPDLALADAGASLGLFGMHERAGYLRGELSLESGPGRGTRVRARIPLEAPGGLPGLDETAERLVHGLVDAHGPIV